jgi:hypothetical protein
MDDFNADAWLAEWEEEQTGMSGTSEAEQVVLASEEPAKKG